MSTLSEMGINVVEDDEVESDNDNDSDSDSDRRGFDRTRDHRGQRRHVDRQEERADRPHRRSRAHVSARDGHGRIAVARGRDRHRQAHRGRPRDDDRGPVRKPAHLPGHHHLARGTERGRNILLRDIIDLEATYAGPEAKQAPKVPTPEEIEQAKKEREEKERALRARPPPRRRHHQCRRRRPARKRTTTRKTRSICRSPRWRPNCARRHGDARHHRLDLCQAAQAAGPACRKLAVGRHDRGAVAEPAEAPLKQLKDELIADVKSLSLNNQRIEAWSSSFTRSTSASCRTRAGCCACRKLRCVARGIPEGVSRLRA
jgi:RNA polymerase primary sigma factor